MAQRFVAKRDVHLVDRQGRKRFYKRNHIRRDGTVGYLPEEITGLSRDHLKFFTESTVDGEGVEQATAAPGEKRSVPRKSTKKTATKTTPKVEEPSEEDE